MALLWKFNSLIMSLQIGLLESSRASGVPLLLDTYPGAAVAYSLRKLRSAYAGNCIRVKRSNDSLTLDIGFVNNVIDLVTLQTFVGIFTGQITIWYDQSGNSNNVIESPTFFNSPSIIIFGVLQTVNGLPTIKFVGNQLNFQTPINANTNLGVFMTAKNINIAAANGALIGGSGGPTAFFGNFTGATAQYAYIGGLNSIYQLISTTPNYANNNNFTTLK